MKPAARRFDNTDCEQHKSGPGVVLPHGDAQVFINGQPAIRLADEARCPFDKTDVVNEGAASVRIGGLPTAGIDDRTFHGSKILTGSGDVNIGGPKFALPKNLHVGGSAEYRNKVIRDLWLLSQTPWGKEMFERLERTGKDVTIVPGVQNEADRGDISYDPDFTAVNRARSGGGPINSPPQVGLGHELVHAVRLAEGKALAKTDNERYWDAEEAIVRGDGARAWDETISENRLRDDLGLPQRSGVDELLREQQSLPIEGPENLRPGGY